MAIIEKKDKPPLTLIVDSDKEVVKLLRMYLQDEGFRTSEAYDGIRGVLHALNDNPDLIITELNLPRLSGYELIKRLQMVSRRTAQVPVMILSSKALSLQERIGLVELEPNVVEFVPKPVTHGAFMVKIHKILGTGLSEKEVLEKLERPRHLTAGEKNIGE
ncbi:response regulator [bacterium]|nr:response regulator [bacterium]MBU3955900.1 response regulator [bacterium]MBU4134645.1 response regulator [bacterium]